MNSTKANRIVKRIEDLMTTIEKEEGVSIKIENINDVGLTFRASLCIKETDENALRMYELFCKKVGFTQNIIGMKFESKNGIYEIIDIKPRNRSYPVIAKSPTGKSYKYSVAHIKGLLGGDKIINRNSNLDKLINE